MRLCSYGKNFLGFIGHSNASFRRIWRAYWAARARWPNGHIHVAFGIDCFLVIRYRVMGCTGIMVTVGDVM